MIKEFQIVKIKGYNRNWILLNVSKQEIEDAIIDTKNTGLHAFGGMWYGDDFTDKHSFGKILNIHEKHVDRILCNDAREENIEYVYNLLGLNLINET